MNRTEHWDKVYAEQDPTRLSWFQRRPGASLQIINRLGLDKDAAVIDVGGGGPSALVGALLDEGFTNVSVMDVSRAALGRCQTRLGAHAAKVTWMQADVIRFSAPRHHYDLWHDRAVFHFLTDKDDQQAYVTVLGKALKPAGYAIIATFAADGPTQCSGLDVVRWDPLALARTLGEDFALVDHCREIHLTPWSKPQAFVYCLFQRLG